MDKATIITKLKERIETLRSLSAVSTQDPSFKKWRRDTEITLEHLFGKDTRHLRDFRSVRFTPGSYNIMNPELAFARAFSNGRGSAEALFQSMIEEVEEYWPGSGEVDPDFEATIPVESKKVFIVHGHQEAIRESVARLLEKLDLEPVILHEQPNKGRTIIEKFVDFSDVAFSVVLLTGDDKGGKNDISPKEYSLRARQNVILELGFFLGRLGRERVCALYEEGVEIPSDYDGIIFIPLDKSGAWRLLLGRELRAAGLEVDLNKIL
jgi:hypothetical protein